MAKKAAWAENPEDYPLPALDVDGRMGGKGGYAQYCGDGGHEKWTETGHECGRHKAVEDTSE